MFTTGLIPVYSSHDYEVYIYEKSIKTSEKKYSYRVAVWLPFIVKQINDELYAIDNYGVDAKNSVIGIEIAKMIRSLVDDRKQLKVKQ